METKKNEIYNADDVIGGGKNVLGGWDGIQ